MSMYELPMGFTVRPARLNDAEAVADLINRDSRDMIGVSIADAGEMRVDWMSPKFNMARDTRLVIAPTGAPVAYRSVWDNQPHVSIWGDGGVDPEYRREQIVGPALTWMVERARESVGLAPDGAKVAVTREILHEDVVSRDALVSHGFELVRHALRMLIEMNGAPPEPVIPDGVTIRPYLVGAEDRALILASREIFKDHWGYVVRPVEEDISQWTHWIENDPDFDPSVWFVAVDGGAEIVGLALWRPKMAEGLDMAYCDTLGVSRKWRRKGLGLALLYRSFGEFYRRGKFRLARDVDVASLTGATRLYEKAGMHVQRQSDVYELLLRDGEDLSTQSLDD